MRRLSVIGNISRDHTCYPDGRGSERFGGAAFHVAVAAARAGARATPVSVIGDDLRDDVPAVLRASQVDLTALLAKPGRSTSFAMEYDLEDRLVGVTAAYGVAEQLTAHALARVARHPHDWYHVCCRHPLDAAPVLQALSACGSSFSVDFIVSSIEHTLARTAHLLPHADIVFTNADEYRVLARQVDISSLRTVIVSNGPQAVHLLEQGRDVLTVMPPTAAPEEVTGAGDTLAGTFLAHRIAGHDDRTALRAAVAAASAHVLVSPPHRR
ncbi:carbohydrate kinase family protein [Streptomyces sp. NPDC006923]|uniref:carbohydrate kinase family protein n=1 Tax=Streptomyces sp. NPDC006923 TaxID=3155355 RepID=UPI0034083AEF